MSPASVRSAMQIDIDVLYVVREVNEAADATVETTDSVTRWIEQNPEFVSELCQDALIESLLERYEESDG
jgi:hypothetical protein